MLKDFINFILDLIFGKKKVESRGKELKLFSKSVFTKEELKLFFLLKQYILDKDLILLSKIRLADIIGSNEYGYFNKLNRKHVDFLITDYKGNVLVVIELDGKSHNSKKMIASDKLKNEVFKKLDIPLIRFQNYQYHDFSKLDDVLV